MLLLGLVASCRGWLLLELASFNIPSGKIRVVEPELFTFFHPPTYPAIYLLTPPHSLTYHPTTRPSTHPLTHHQPLLHPSFHVVAHPPSSEPGTFPKTSMLMDLQMAFTLFSAKMFLWKLRVPEGTLVCHFNFYTCVLWPWAKHVPICVHSLSFLFMTHWACSETHCLTTMLRSGQHLNKCA